MKKIAFVFSAMLLSVPAFAAIPDFSVLSEVQKFQMPRDGGEIRACFKSAWAAANPAREQNERAREELTAMKTVFEENRAALEGGLMGLLGAWKAHPVSIDDVKAAEEALKTAITPVHEAVRTGSANVLNLLTAEQRSVFDDKLLDCLQAE